MIFLPAIILALAEAAMIGGLVGGVICGLEDKRTLPSDADKSHRTAHICAAEGAFVGGVFGAAGAVVAPAFGAVGVVDDMAKGLVDDVAKPALGVVDDSTMPARRGLRYIAIRSSRDISAPLKLEANISRATYYKSLRVPKNANPNGGFVYVAEVKKVSSKELYKIGFTKNPSQRLKEIQYRLNKTVGGKANFTCIISTNNIFQLESAMHAAFKAERIRNFAAGTEFFHLNPAQLALACSS